jgi:hypothetical protein
VLWSLERANHQAYKVKTCFRNNSANASELGSGCSYLCTYQNVTNIDPESGVAEGCAKLQTHNQEHDMPFLTCNGATDGLLCQLGGFKTVYVSPYVLGCLRAWLCVLSCACA